MKNVAAFLIDNKGGFVYGENVKQAQIRIMLLDPNKIADLVKLAETEGLKVSLQNGLSVTEDFAEVAAKAKKTPKKK